jgi:hypothetical protein
MNKKIKLGHIHALPFAGWHSSYQVKEKRSRICFLIGGANEITKDRQNLAKVLFYLAG